MSTAHVVMEGVVVPDPNVSEPDPISLFRSAVAGVKAYEQARPRLAVWIEDGATAEVALWAQTASQKWILLESGLAIPSPFVEVFFADPVPPNTFLFLQITAATGASLVYGGFQ